MRAQLQTNVVLGVEREAGGSDDRGQIDRRVNWRQRRQLGGGSAHLFEPSSGFRLGRPVGIDAHDPAAGGGVAREAAGWIPAIADAVGAEPFGIADAGRRRYLTGGAIGGVGS